MFEKKGGLSTLQNGIIIAGMVVAIGVVFLIIYNIVSAEVEYSSESDISLQIQKNSVFVDEATDKVTLKITREEGNSELEKIKFILFDGQNIEEIERDAKDFKENSEKSFEFTPKLVTNIQRISIVPIIKVDGKKKYLKVANTVTITKTASGETTVEEITLTCASLNGILCSTAQTCPSGKSLDSSDTGICCSVTCVVQTKTPTTNQTTSPTTNTTTPITPSPVCGNNICDSTETSVSCPSDCGTYSWISSSWIACSVSCGGGTQTRTVTCQRNDGTNVSDSLCNPPKPDLNQACNTQSCVYALSVSKSGTGTITSNPSGINCGSTCSYNYNSGTSVTLTATAGLSYSFSSWTNCPSPSGNTCLVTMSSAKSVTANFVSSCTPTTCSVLGKNCGSWDDGCGGTLSCGSCSGGQTCVSGTCATQVLTWKSCVTGQQILDLTGGERSCNAYCVSLGYVGCADAGIEYFCSESTVCNGGEGVAPSCYGLPSSCDDGNQLQHHAACKCYSYS